MAAVAAALAAAVGICSACMLAPERRLCHAKLCTLMWRPTTAVWLQPLSLWRLRPCTPGLCSTQCPSQPPLQTVKNDPQRAQRYHSEAERLDAAASQATQNSAITNGCAPWHGSCVNVVVLGSQPAQGTVPLVHSRAWPSRCHALPDINKCCRLGVAAKMRTRRRALAPRTAPPAPWWMTHLMRWWSSMTRVSCSLVR